MAGKVEKIEKENCLYPKRILPKVSPSPNEEKANHPHTFMPTGEI